MRPRYFFLSVIFDAVLAVILASCATPPSIATQISSPPDARGALTEHIASPTDANELASAMREPDSVQGTLMQDGLTLIKSHCARCHVPAWFDQIEKPRAEWEMVLERMKSMGVQLSDAEETILLDYLAAANKP